MDSVGWIEEFSEVNIFLPFHLLGFLDEGFPIFWTQSQSSILFDFWSSHGLREKSLHFHGMFSYKRKCNRGAHILNYAIKVEKV